MKLSFMSSKHSNEKKYLMHSKSYNEEIMTTFDTEQTTEELSHLLLQRCEVSLEQTMKDS